MPLIDLKSDLTSCKYGHDRPGGGDSGQPFIISYSDGGIEVNTSARNPLALVGVRSIPAIPNFTTLLGRKKIGQFILDAVNGDDFIRGGGAGVLQASINDVFRISTFLASLPKGPIFLAKQIGLQLSNPVLETRKGAITLTGIGGLAGRLTGGTLQPTRIYNLGINTLAQVGVNAFGGHFIRHGLSPFQGSGDPNFSYEKIVENNNLDINNVYTTIPAPYNPNIKVELWSNYGNRLIKLKEKFNLGYYTRDSFINLNKATNKSFVSVDQFLRRDSPENRFSLSNTVGTAKTLEDVLVLGGTTRERGDQDIISRNIGGPDSAYGIGFTTIRRQYKSDDEEKLKISLFQSNIYSGKSRNSKGEPTTFADSNLSLYKKGPSYINGYGNVVSLKVFNFKDNFRENRVSSGRADGINKIPIFESNTDIEGEVLIGGKLYNLTDLVNFQIKAIDGTTPSLNKIMVFRAYLTQFSDSTDATWNNIKYPGRGEDFYIYNGFSRKIQIGFKVAALSAQEMKPMYQKLNYLMSNLMPDYDDGLMRGPLVKMTVGNWFYNQEGILNSLSYTVPNESPWEIAISDVDGSKPLVLPHVIEVQMTFTPIGVKNRGDNLAPQKALGYSNIAQTPNNDATTTQYITGSIYSTSKKDEIISDAATIEKLKKVNEAFTSGIPVASIGSPFVEMGSPSS